MCNYHHWSTLYLRTHKAGSHSLGFWGCHACSRIPLIKLIKTWEKFVIVDWIWGGHNHPHTPLRLRLAQSGVVGGILYINIQEPTYAFTIWVYYTHKRESMVRQVFCKVVQHHYKLNKNWCRRRNLDVLTYIPLYFENFNLVILYI